jgi:aryl-alcohol dehydrogenase-like predicted oxidoreductase
MKPLHPTALPLPISPLALGTWALAGDKFWGPQAEADSIATIHAALDAGVTLIDTAPAYGDGLSEQVVGKALRDHRDRALIATKISEADMTPEKAVASCEASLRRLQTDCVDLLQIHWLGTGEHLEDVIATMEKLRDAGKVRTLGVCNFGPQSLGRLRASGHGWITNQLAYNLIWRAIEFEIVGACQRDGLGILCYSPLHQGLLTGRFRTANDVPAGRTRTRHFRADRPMSRHGGAGCEELTFATIDRIRTLASRLGQPMADVALAWLLHRPGVSSVIFGARTPQQIHANVAAGRLQLDAATMAELGRCTDELKTVLGPSADMWAGESRIR